MLRHSFNAGWSVREKVNPFLEVMGMSPQAECVTLPHDWLIGRPRSADHASGAPMAYYPDGVVEYTKTFTAPPEYKTGRVELAFDGVYREAMVYVNGSFAGQRKSGYAPFSVRIDPFLREGDNTVRVEASHHRDERWYTGLGIYRAVDLLLGGPVHVAPNGVRVRTVNAGADLGVIEVTSEINSVAHGFEQVRLTTEVLDPSGSVVACDTAKAGVRPGESTRTRQRFVLASPQRWSVETPALYRCRTRLSSGTGTLEECETIFGVRELTWDAARGLQINGETVKLRGGAIHHDSGLLGAATIARAEERRVELLKNAGYNAIRSAHNPISDALLQACDRLGMLVMDEAFDVWTSTKADYGYASDFPTWWRDDLAAMVERDYNHPSVILYSIGNEIQETGDRWDAGLGAKMVDLIKEIDDTRPVTNAVNPIMSLMPQFAAAMNRDAGDGGINTAMNDMASAIQDFIVTEPATEGIDEALSQLDVAGLNYAHGRYTVDLSNHPQRLLIGTESNGPRLDEIWALVESDPRIIGDFSWTAWEYLGEAGLGRTKFGESATSSLFGAYPWRLSATGDLTVTGRRRTVSFWRETVWGLRTDPVLAVYRPHRYNTPAIPSQWSWSDTTDSWSWPGHEGAPIGVEVYTTGDEVELLLDGQPLGRVDVKGERRCVARFETVYRPGRLTAVAYRDTAEIGRTDLRSAAEDEMLLTAAADRSTLTAGDRDLAFIEIALGDRIGVVHVTQSRAITVTVDGPGVLQGLGSDDPASENNYTDATCDLYEGRAMAIVRPTGPGEITVRVTTDQGEAAETLLRVVASDAASAM
uniref:glycoside hydrolase family 2 TIM barrel-domain containing protein n=1 Tax=Streptomyces ardesiacus TaxID=285564 RepID=UPI003F49DF71